MLLSLASSVTLGLYEIAKKASLRNNAVPAVLLLHVVTAATIWTPLIIVSHVQASVPGAGVQPSKEAARGITAAGETTANRERSATDEIVLSPVPELLRVDRMTPWMHLLILFKALIAGGSWVLSSYALKHLPMSIASPIRASSPLWTILIAVLFMGERPSLIQWTGVSVIVVSFYAFSLVGRTEGIHFHRDRWVLCMIAGTLMGSLSALYDKYLLQVAGLSPATTQAWFSVDLVLVMLPVFAWWWFRERSARPFEWRWSIPLIAVLLLISDFLYFAALKDPGAMISLVSPVRRTSVIIAFLAGIRLYGERNWKPKAACIAGLLIGVFVLSRSRS